jgi:vacuolar protein sorting-associated protein 11
LFKNGENKDNADDCSEDDEAFDILDDIQEALTLARRQGVIPPVRIARILAGEGAGQFRSDRPFKERKQTVPLSVALDYVGTVLEKSRKEASRLKSEIEEYNQLCHSMESEIASLLRVSYALPPLSNDESYDGRLNIDELFAKVKSDEVGPLGDVISEPARESFWREMNQSDDSFDTISRFFAKGTIG